MPLSNIQKIIVDKGICVTYIISTHNNQKTYYYIGVEGNKMPSFINALKSGPVELNDWGKIITSGYREPSDELKKEMASKFQCDSKQAINLLA